MANSTNARVSQGHYARRANAEGIKDTITVLGCTLGYRATKIHCRTNGDLKTEGFNAGMYFQSHVISISCIRELSAVLTNLEPTSNMLVIRGLPQPHVEPDQPHQRTKNPPTANYRTPADGHRYVMIDIDKLALPAALNLSKTTLPRVIRHVVARLPDEFHNATFHCQLSSSAGISDPTKVSMHLWFWLDRPIPDQDLKRWGTAVNAASGIKLIDTALFNDVQAHYTAAPLFKGMDNPFPERSWLVRKGRDEVALVLPSSVPKPSDTGKSRPAKSVAGKTRTTKSVLTSSSAGLGFDYHVASIGDHAGGEGFHEPLLRAAASYVATRGANDIDKERLYETLRRHVLSADASCHSPDEVENRASREHIMPIIDSALKKYGNQTPSTARLRDGIAPHYESKPLPNERATAKLKRLVSNLF